MKLDELQKKIADVLGVSASQKELSFEIFVTEISAILLEHITLKVPRIGFFQLKNTPSKNGIRPLIFSPLSEDFSQDTQNLYIKIDVAPKIKNTPEFDSNIFSIGVGKPLLPLSIDELPDTETSYAMLKKSIEERVKELLMESDQIPNFNIWDDYYKSPEEYEEESVDGTKSQLYELTSDLEFTDEIIPDKFPENISDNFNLSSSHSNQTSQLDYSNLLDEESKSKEETENYDDLLVTTNEESELNLGDVLFPPEEKAYRENIIEITSDEEDYSALKDLRLDDLSNDTITISDLLEDLTPQEKKDQLTINDVIEKGENVVPVQETLDKILADEKVGEDKKKVEISIEDQSEQKSPSFEELHNLSTEVIPSNEIGEDSLEKKQTEENKKNSEIISDELTKSKSRSFEELHNMSNEVVSSNEIEEDSLGINNKENKEENSEIFSDDLTESKSSSFEELHKLNNEVISSREMEDDSLEESRMEEGEEKIEWNWGDELREEFGIPTENENVKYEMLQNGDSESKGDIELVDDFLEDEKVTKDLFSQLEKTLEREFNYDQEPKHRLTVEDKKASQEKDTLKKVLLEFSGPPAKYEFIEDRKSEKEKRMAISLIDESNEKIKKPSFTTEEEIRSNSKDSYFGKMFFIIFGAFIVVAAVVVFIIINGNNKNLVREESKPIEQEQTSSASDSENVGTLTQPNPKTKDPTTLAYDDLSDFPRTATPPVPIKDATDKQILETIKKETAKLQSSKRMEEKPAAKQSNVKPENQSLYKTVTTDTKVSNRVFYDGKNYFLQVSSWPNRIRAEEEVNRLRALGFNAFIIEANLPQKGGIWYRVRVGPFKTEKETDEFLKKNNL